MNKFFTTILLIGMFTCASAADIYVNHLASGANDGTSWTDAYTELQDALDNAAGGDNIKIAEGTYIPKYTLTGSTTSSTDRNNAFHIANKDVTISGGWDASVGTQTGGNTILSGDIGTASVSTDNTYHVFVSVGQTNSAIFENLVFTDGSALTVCGSSPSYGGVTVYNCSGSAVNMNNSSPIFNNCAFLANTISQYGALVADGSAAPEFNNCLFQDNVSTNDAVMHANTSGSLEFINCSFIDNTTTSNSSAIGQISTGNVLLVNCLFFGNSGGSSDNFRGTLNASSSNNSADAAATTLSSSTNYLSLASESYASLFVNSASEIGADDVWMTSDDGLMPLNTSVLKLAGTSTGAPTTDIIGETRYASPTIGAYKSQVLSSTTLYDGNANSVGKNSTTSPNSEITLSNFTVPAGDDRVLLVATIHNHNTANNVGATFNGVAMSKVQNSSNLVVFSLTLGSGSAITGDVVANGSFFFCSLGAQSFSNINQTTPIDNVTTASGTGTSLSETVSSATGDLVCDFIAVHDYQYSSAFTISADASQTVTIDENSGHHATGSPYFVLASSIKEGASSVDMDWTFPSSASTHGHQYIGLNLNIADPNALPVDFTLFEVSKSPSGAILDWQTTMEENNSHFEVQRSFDGQNWELVGEVQGQGTTLETTNYQFVDKLEAHSLKQTAQVYYRLKQVDYNGQFDFSGTRTLNFKQEALKAFTIWPNPSLSNLISLSATDDYSIFSTSGFLIKSYKNSNQLNVSELEKGTYLISNPKGKTVLYMRN
ncbi:MAG: hypothetical protein ACPGLV_12385 [Bacteroidia bacterium]